MVALAQGSVSGSLGERAVSRNVPGHGELHGLLEPLFVELISLDKLS